MIAEIGKGARLTPKEMSQVRATLKEQIGYWDGFCQAIADQRKALAAKGWEGDELEEAFNNLYDKFDRRALSYAGAIEAEGERWAMAGMYEDGQWFRWTLSEAEHCPTCLERDGTIAQMKDGRLPYYPKDGSTICLMNCLCHWEPISRFKAMALRALGKLKQVFRRKSFDEIADEWLAKGGEGSGWYAPPKGTHTAGGKTRTRAHNQEWADKSFREWEDGLTDVERKAIKDYQGAKHRVINGVLRKKVGMNDEGVTAGRIDAITEALDKSKTPEDMVVWRGLGSDRAGNYFGDMSIGSEFRDKGFVSSSLQGEYALKEFGSHGKVAGARVHVPKGSRAAYIGGLETQPGQWEGEILIQRGSRFKVLGFEKIGDREIISLELLGSEPQDFFRSYEEQFDWEEEHG